VPTYVRGVKKVVCVLGEAYGQPTTVTMVSLSFVRLPLICLVVVGLLGRMAQSGSINDIEHIVVFMQVGRGSTIFPSSPLLRHNLIVFPAHGTPNVGACNVMLCLTHPPAQPLFLQENRAFDHYYGTMKGVRGFNDRTVSVGVLIPTHSVNISPSCCWASTGTTTVPTPLRFSANNAPRRHLLSHQTRSHSCVWVVGTYSLRIACLFHHHSILHPQPPSSIRCRAHFG
jgi:hypothetical protein